MLSFVEKNPTEYYYIPTSPTKASSTQSANNGSPLWLAFNWIRIEAPAPVENILWAYTIAAFDDCWWHVNPNVWYHYHAENWCAPRIDTEDHDDLIWLALDWFEIYEYNESLSDLDDCGGHTDDVRWYHYHLASPWLNQQLWCFSGWYGCVLSEDGTCDASADTWRRWWPQGWVWWDRPPRPEEEGQWWTASSNQGYQAAAWSAAEVVVIETFEASIGDDGYFWSYGINDENFGTLTKVAVAWDIRTINTNALPNHSTWEFPNEENPNTMSAQNNLYEIPTKWEYQWSETWAREPWIAINGIKFEPETNERVNCESWEQYRIEWKQTTFPVMWIDHENAHVQPTGTYHYHGLSKSLVEFADTWDDLVHIWFAKDWFNIFYSKSGKYKPSFKLSTEPRVGTNCNYRDTPVQIEWTTPDGTYATDRVFDASVGDLDTCNWIEVNWEYMYFATDEFPYLPRCLNWESNERWWPPPWWAWWWDRPWWWPAPR